ncbi:MAG: L-threonylcarbamoyladenylate synthase [Pseudomonadota bacterium]
MEQMVAADRKGIAGAVDILRAGRLAALPTETVYGLAADASKPEAVAKIYAAKGRPQFNPLIAHVADFEQAFKLALYSKDALKLTEAFWPGPLTLVLPYLGDAVCDLARAGLDTIAIRIPAHPVMQAVLKEFGGVLVAPSANISGHVSATSAQHVAADFGDKINLILDGGATQYGVESTIIDVTDQPVLLRAGAITAQQIEGVLGQKLQIKILHDPQNPSAPGQLSAHYATHTKLRLNATQIDADEALLAFGTPLQGAREVLNLSASADPVEAAANLFAHLRTLDRLNAKVIAVMPIPETGLGAAINDRLQRAAIGSGQ